MRLQFAEHPRPLARAFAENTGNRKLGVVVENRLRHAVEKRERPHMPIAKRVKRPKIDPQSACNSDPRLA
jgi:hypothetical protein